MMEMAAAALSEKPISMGAKISHKDTELRRRAQKEALRVRDQRAESVMAPTPMKIRDGSTDHSSRT